MLQLKSLKSLCISLTHEILENRSLTEYLPLNPITWMFTDHFDGLSLPGLPCSQAGQYGIECVATRIGHDHVAAVPADVDPSRNDTHDLSPRSQVSLRRWTARRLLVALMWQPETFQRRRRACFDHTSIHRPAAGQPIDLKRDRCRRRVRCDGT